MHLAVEWSGNVVWLFDGGGYRRVSSVRFVVVLNVRFDSGINNSVNSTSQHGV